MAGRWQQTHISDLTEGSHGRTTVVVFFPSHVLCQAVGGEGIKFKTDRESPLLLPKHFRGF